jgi:hypothetical protein
VTAEGAELVSRAGESLQSYESPRTITAAAYADGMLVLADQAMFTTLDGDFATLGSGTLTESCAGAVVLSGGRFVCGPENDWDRLLYTYDAIEGSELAVSMPYTYNGIPMRPVPGLDEFITVTVDLSPSDFHLYAVGSGSDTVVYVNESPYHGDFPVELGYAFIGDPATHVVIETGAMLLIHGDGCEAGGTFDATCFEKDGELGTLPPDVLSYLELREAADGSLYGLLANFDAFYGDLPCAETPCTLQRIDPAQKLVVAAASITTPRTYNFLRPDPSSSGVVVITTDEAPFHGTYVESDSGFEALYYGL